MTLCWFAIFEDADPAGGVLGDADMAALQAFLRDTPGLSRAMVHVPASAHDPMLHDGAPPALVLQAWFEGIEALEAALSPQGHLQALPGHPVLVRLGARRVSQQAMLVRRFPVPQAAVAGTPRCTYLVAYEGPAQNLNAWLSDYISGHAPLMAQLPGVRGVEVYTRIDWCGFLPWPRAEHMQRNQVVFDSPQALEAALQSPLRARMREHYAQLPPFSGTVTHFPMRSFPVEP